MVFVNYTIHASREEVAENLKNNIKIAEELGYDHAQKRPIMIIKENGESIRMTCELMSRGVRDNGFVFGTVFRGRLTEHNGVTALRGIILTAPVYHLFIIAIFAYFIYQCFALGGFSVVPVCLLIVSAFLFKDEFKKQSMIKRHIFCALKLTYRSKQKHAQR